VLERRYRYLAQSSLRGVGGNWFASSAALAALTLCFFLWGLLAAGALALRQSLPLWWTSDKATLYLLPESSEEEQQRLIRFLKGASEIAEVRILSSQEAKKRLEHQLGGWKQILSGIEDPILPTTIEIAFKPKVRHGEQIEAVLDRVRRQPAVEEVFYGKSWVERIESATSGLRLAGTGLMYLLALGIFFIILHAVKSSVESRREELEAYEILGATFLFGKVPFYVQGFLLGSAGALMGGVPAGLLVLRAEKVMPLPISGMVTLDLWKGVLLMLGLILTGAVLGVGGGWLGARLYGPWGRVSS